MNPFQRPEQWFPDNVTDVRGQPIALGLFVEVKVGRRHIVGEVVGWRSPGSVRILTDSLHMHTVALQEVLPFRGLP